MPVHVRKRSQTSAVQSDTKPFPLWRLSIPKARLASDRLRALYTRSAVVTKECKIVAQRR
jgi:hypothetical protein